MLPRSLQVEPAVSQLPLRLRPVARAAAAGSSSDFMSLFNLAKGDPNSQAPLLLPVVFANFHPRFIPTADQADAHPDDFRVTVAKAVRALEYLSVIKSIPPDAALAVLHRVRDWISFLQCHWAFIPPLSQYSELSLSIAILLLVGKLKQDQEIAKELHQMPCLCIIVARAWKLFILEPEERTPRAALTEVCTFLSAHTRDSKHLPHLEEFIEGADGSLSGLAELTLRHLNRYVSRPLPVNPFTLDISYLCRVLMFVIRSPDNKPFQDALHSHGVLTTFVHAASVLSERLTGRDDEHALLANDMLPAVWAYLNKRITDLHSPRPVREAVRAGILRVIISFPNHSDHSTNDSLRSILSWIELYTVYQSVLSSLELAFIEVKDLQSAQGFTRSPLFYPWSLLWDTAQRRITILKYYESDDYISQKACDSLQCGNIYRKRDLMRCSFCRRQYYCSRRCQTADWNDDHRDACPRLSALNQQDPEKMSARNRSFLRALIDAEYKENQEAILLWQLDFMNEHPDEIPCLLFDFTRVTSLGFMRASDLGDKWPDEVARAARGNGRIQLHVACIPGYGVATQRRMVPMQSSSGALSDGLKGLKRELDEGVGSSRPIHAQIQGRISSLVSLT
ncbi:MYND-type domain-containing protein [Mycena venus]|uniref:MYND-type domain-containing protein n=1 Tax=Mycena venus TaxID=2733690 RepID=A0A8H6X7H0_9AGAR|nr:MYND-type domain-containing protein [Mycena venus]